jgi:hypothetical protein
MALLIAYPELVTSVLSALKSTDDAGSPGMNP